MAVIRPTSYVDAGGQTAWVRHGGSTIDGVLADQDDATWDLAGGSGTTYIMRLGMPTIDHTIDPNTRWLNVKMRRAAVPDNPFGTGSNIQWYLIADDGSAFNSAQTIDVKALLDGTTQSGSFIQFAFQPSGVTFDSPGGSSPANTLWFRFLGAGSNPDEIDVSEISWGDSLVSVDYPKSGGASVTMSGSAAVVRTPVNTPKAGAASVTMSASTTVIEGHEPTLSGAGVTMSGKFVPGTDLSFPGAPPRTRVGMNSYFFFPPGSTVGITDDSNPYQGMGLRPPKKGN